MAINKNLEMQPYTLPIPTKYKLFAQLVGYRVGKEVCVAVIQHVYAGQLPTKGANCGSGSFPELSRPSSARLSELRD